MPTPWIIIFFTTLLTVIMVTSYIGFFTMENHTLNNNSNTNINKIDW